MTHFVDTVLKDQRNPLMSNPNPNCDKECRFQYGVAMTTAMYFAPVYDKHGNNLNPDGNTTTGSVTCNVCGKRWTSVSQFGKTEFLEIKEPVQKSSTSV